MAFKLYRQVAVDGRYESVRVDEGEVASFFIDRLGYDPRTEAGQRKLLLREKAAAKRRAAKNLGPDGLDFMKASAAAVRAGYAWPAARPVNAAALRTELNAPTADQVRAYIQAFEDSRRFARTSVTFPPPCDLPEEVDDLQEA